MAATIPNTWQGWERDLLKAAGLPVNSNTLIFMSDWWTNKNSYCPRNPVDISTRGGWSSGCYRLPSGKTAQAFTSRTAAANAFADELNLTDYRYLREALASGNPYAFANPNGVALDLEKWGSTRFQAYYAQKAGASATSGGGGSSGSVPHVSQAWMRWMKILAHEMSADIKAVNKATAQLNRVARHH